MMVIVIILESRNMQRNKHVLSILVAADTLHVYLWPFGFFKCLLSVNIAYTERFEAHICLPLLSFDEMWTSPTSFQCQSSAVF
jgi:hypothetical protein